MTGRWGSVAIKLACVMLCGVACVACVRAIGALCTQFGSLFVASLPF